MHIHGLQKLAMVDYPGSWRPRCSPAAAEPAVPLLPQRIADDPAGGDAGDPGAGGAGLPGGPPGAFGRGGPHRRGSPCSSRTRRIFCGRCGNWALP